MSGQQDIAKSLKDALSPEKLTTMAHSATALAESMDRAAQSLGRVASMKDIYRTLVSLSRHRKDMDDVFGDGFMDTTDRVRVLRVRDTGNTQDWERVSELDLADVDWDTLRGGDNYRGCPYMDWRGHGALPHFWRYLEGQDSGRLFGCPGRPSVPQEDT